MSAEIPNTKLTGMIAGLARTRRGLSMEEEVDKSRDDEFMLGYSQGKKMRDDIIDEAVERMRPNLNSYLQLSSLVDEAEQLLSDMDSGSFDSEEFANAVARARVHLADHSPKENEITETIRKFEADERLLGYFGRLYRAADAYVDAMSPNVEPNKHDDLKNALILPPDIEAAVEGPRGRSVDG